MSLRPEVRIRFAKAADVALIHELVLCLAEYEKLTHAVTTDEAALREHLFGARPAAEVLLAEATGDCIGFALFFHNFSTFVGKPGLYLEDLFVRPEARGRGAGKALMVTLARLARARGCGRFEWSVLDWNTPSIDFYRAIGAQPLEDWTLQRMTGEALERLAAQRIPGDAETAA